MHIHCNKCNTRAAISEHEETSPGSIKLYCQCLNGKECGHRFVMNMEFSHTLTPAASTVESVPVGQTRGLPPRVHCNKCGSVATLKSRDSISVDIARFYCACKNKDCGHRFVTVLAFSHTLVPATGSIDRMLFDRLREIPHHQRREMFEQLGMS